MGIFGQTRRQLARRVADLEASAPPPGSNREAWQMAAGPSLAWTGSDYVTRSDAMAVPTLSYIRAQLAGGVASMPLERFRVNALTGDETQIPEGWCADPDPAPTVTRSVFWAWVIDDLFFQGKSTLIVMGRDSSGYPVEFRRVLPGQITYDPQTLAQGLFASPLMIYYLGAEIPWSDVVVIDGPHDGLCNYGAGTIRQALDLEAASAQAAAEPVPNIDLHQTGGEPIGTTAAEELVASWKLARAAGATAYTPSNLEARPLGFSSADQQLLEARQYMSTQLARLAGVNPVLVSAAMGSASSYVYTNQADYRQAFLDDVLDSYLQAIEGRLSAQDVTPRGQQVRFDRDAFTRMPLAQRVQIFTDAAKAGTSPLLINQLAGVLDLDFQVVDSSPADAPTADQEPTAPAPAPAPQPALPSGAPA